VIEAANAPRVIDAGPRRLHTLLRLETKLTFACWPIISTAVTIELLRERKAEEPSAVVVDAEA